MASKKEKKIKLPKLSKLPKTDKVKKQKKEAARPDFKKMLAGLKNLGGSNKKSILSTLLVAFMVPVVLMIALGVVSYRTASSGIVDKYKESAQSTVSAVGDYFNLVCTNISNKAVEMITNSDVGDYYDKYYGKQESKALETFRSAKSDIGNAKSTNKNIYSCTVIPEGGAYLSTLSGGMTETPVADFSNTAEGQYFAANSTQRNRWLGYQTYLDDNMQSKQEKYAMVYYQKFSNSDAYLVMSLDISVAEKMLGEIDFGKGSVKALVTADGREVAFEQKTDNPAEADAVSDEKEEAADAKQWFVGSDFYESTKEAEEPGYMDVKINGKKYVYIYTPVGNTKAMICTLIPQSNVLGQVGSIKYITIFMVILAAGAALVTGFVISTGISKTVREMSGGLAKVAQGDLTQDFTTKRQDEFKELTGSLNAMIESMRGLMRDMKQFGSKVTGLAENVSDKTGVINTSMQDIARAMDEVAGGVQGQAEDTESSNENMISFSENITTVTEKTSHMGLR